MSKTRGILLNSNFDLDILVRRNSEGKIVSGLRIGNSVYQQQTLLLVHQKGVVRSKPLVGVGLNNYLLDDASNDSLFQEISAQFTADGMRVFGISITNGKLDVDANYQDGSDFK